MALISEVLPAPFGPMIARISPLRAWRSTPCSACTPPKARETFCTSRRGAPSSESTIGPPNLRTKRSYRISRDTNKARRFCQGTGPSTQPGRDESVALSCNHASTACAPDHCHVENISAAPHIARSAGPRLLRHAKPCGRLSMLRRPLRAALLLERSLFDDPRQFQRRLRRCPVRSDPDGLHVDELADPVRGEFAPVAAPLHAAEGQARVRCHYAVDEHRAGLDRACQPPR